MISGIFISRVIFPNINIGNEQWFKVSHISVSFLVLILVAAHIGLHWQWVINVCENMTKFKKSKKSLSIAAKLATVALLVVGIYEINETGFLGKNWRSSESAEFKFLRYAAKRRWKAGF